MNAVMILLLVIIGLAAAVRIVDSRRVSGFVMLGTVGFLLLGISVSERRASHDTARVSEPSSVVTASFSVASETEGDGEGVAGAEPVADVDVDAGVDAEPADTESREPTTTEPAETASDDPADPQSPDISVETGEVVIPPRPEWVEADEVRSGDVHTTAVSSGPHETQRECRKALDRELEQAVCDYIDWYLGSVHDERFRASTLVRYDLDEIKRRLVPSGKVYHEVIRVSFGPMHQMHAQLAFDQAFRRELDSRRSELERHWKEWIVRGRLLGTALGFGVLLAVMGVFFGYFRLDTATRGFYTARLQWTAAVAILALLTAGALLAGHILQM